ncbi:hypothetical protein BHM03_00007705 [Ensete ventricosum]|nr:hypothetical protein BHM03_00007705 [Ensete ventricosum]
MHRLVASRNASSRRGLKLFSLGEDDTIVRSHPQDPCKRLVSTSVAQMSYSISPVTHSFGSMTIEERMASRDQFPVGMRVLAVDDDPICLRLLEALLRRCQYNGFPLYYLEEEKLNLISLTTRSGAYGIMGCLSVCVPSVTTTDKAITALKLLRENKDKFDLVISDVHMPDMDGFKLLELVGLEMDLPVISKS